MTEVDSVLSHSHTVQLSHATGAQSDCVTVYRSILRQVGSVTVTVYVML